MAARFARGGRLFVFGNGGSSTDAAGRRHAVRRPRARSPPAAGGGAADDVATLTALANDVGFEVVFARPLAAAGRPDDIAFGLSTSGGSANVLRGLAAARERGLLTVGLAGYAGGGDGRGGRTRRDRPPVRHALGVGAPDPGGADHRPTTCCGSWCSSRSAPVTCPRDGAAAWHPGHRASCRASGSGRSCTGWPAQLGLAGFVGNDERGVFIEAEGRAAALDALLAALRERPPPLARGHRRVGGPAAAARRARVRDRGQRRRRPGAPR